MWHRIFPPIGLSTVDDMNAYFTDMLSSQYENERLMDLQTKVMEQLEAGCEVELPEGLLGRAQRPGDPADRGFRPAGRKLV